MIFQPDTDSDYHKWLDKNSGGFVINSDKACVNRKLPMIHGSGCFHINDKNWPNYTTADYMKLCPLDQSELEEWVERDGRGMKFCKDCKSQQLI
jgi:hypothetical protein